MEIIIINGPNLNLLGRRRPEIYGHNSMHTVMQELATRHPHVECTLRESNSEGEIIDMLHEYGFSDRVAGIIINPGAYTHYSYAIADAIEAIERPVVEVHISNIHAREEFRRHSVTAPFCQAAIAGMGLYGYIAAADFLLATKP